MAGYGGWAGFALTKSGYSWDPATQTLTYGTPAPSAPTTTAPTTTTAQTIEDTGSNPNAGMAVDWVDELYTLFKQNGLEDLAGTLTGLVQQGYTGSALTLSLQNSDAYAQRFAANDARKKAGLPVLSPAEYLSAESTYRQIMSEAGLPAGFYDDKTDFQAFIANDTSPAEVKNRVDDAVQLAKKTDPAYRQMLSDAFGVGLTDGDIAAYFLDQKRALPLLQKQVDAVGIADAARRQGLSYDAQRATQLAELGITGAQADQAYGQIADATATYGKAAAATGLQYDQTAAENEVLLNDANARRKRQGIETAFGAENSKASSTKAKGALSGDTSGSY